MDQEEDFHLEAEASATPEPEEMLPGPDSFVNHFSFSAAIDR